MYPLFRCTTAVLLTLAMLCLLCACGTTSTGAKDPTTSTTTMPSRSEEFAVGTIEGNTYQNLYFGIGCTLDDGWVLDSESAMKERNLTRFEPADSTDEAYWEALKNAQEFYDMYATSNDGSVVAVRMENIPSMYDFVPTEAEYAQLQFEQMPDVVSPELIRLPISGVERSAVKVTLNFGDTPQYDTFVYLACGKYMIIVEISTFGTDTAETLLSQFYTW